MKRKLVISFVAGLILCLWFGVGFAEPVKWSGNGHYYDVVEDGSNMSWEEARDWASGLTYTDASGQLFKGYLATITSSQEDDFIASLHFTQTNYLLGGYQTPATDEATSAEKKADWHWVTGEEWQYADWRSGEPNNFFRWVGVVGAGQSEEYLQYFPASTSGSWNDVYTGTVTDSDGEHFFGIRNFVVEYEADASFLLVTVDGVDVSFDWSAMPEANSYVLAVALSDNGGNVDMGTLNFFDMGTQRTFSTAGLPSSMIFYAVILAYTDKGLVVSGTVKYMPFSGTVTYPGVDNIIMQLDDPGGIGSLTVYGNPDGSIEHISGDDGTGPFLFTVINGKPATYTKGNLHLDYINRSRAMVESPLPSAKRQSETEIDCLARVKLQMIDVVNDFECERRANEGMIRALSILGGYGTGNFTSKGLAGAMFIASLVAGAQEDLKIKFARDLDRLLGEYDDCSNSSVDPDPGPTPDPVPGPVPLINIDNSCPHPDEAKHWVFEYETGQDEGWSISGIGQVGKKLSFVSEEAYGTLHLQREICYASGAKNGWEITYQDDGNMLLASHYVNGVLDGHSYDFYEDGTGSLYIDNTFVNGVNTYRLVYYEDGSLKMWWDRDENIWHWTD